MDKIEGSGHGQLRSGFSRKSKKKGAIPRAFSGILDELLPESSNAVGISSIATKEELESVIDSIHQLGEDLLKHPGADTLARYKQALRNFIGYVSNHAYSTEEYISRKDILNQKKYAIIRVVDEKLERLSQSVWTSQKKQIDMLSGIEEIQGLLVNLLHLS